MTAKGGCRCGAVRFEVFGDISPVVFCHCDECRAQTGLYVASTEVADADLKIEGSDNVRWHPADHNAARGFCQICGSLLFWKQEGSDRTAIMAGAYDDDVPLEASCHIRVADKPSWYTINDDLPQHAGSLLPSSD